MKSNIDQINELTEKIKQIMNSGVDESIYSSVAGPSFARSKQEWMRKEAKRVNKWYRDEAKKEKAEQTKQDQVPSKPSRLNKYIKEVEQHQYQPLTGDVVSFQINEELEISADVTEVLDEGIVLNLDATALAILENLELIALEEDQQSPRPNLEKLHNLGFENSPAGEQARQNWKTATGETHPAAEDYDIKKQKAQDVQDQMSGVVRSSDRKYSVTVEKEVDDGVVKKWFRLEGPGVTPNTYVDWNPYSNMTTQDLDLYVKLGMPSRSDIDSIGPMDSKDLKKLANERGLTEAKYQGRTVKLGKPMRGDVRKFKVFVKNPKTGNVKKVNFGDPNMEIKRDDPKRRKNFRARHGCGTGRAKDRTKAAYWSCRMWSSKPVSKIVKEHADSE